MSPSPSIDIPASGQQHRNPEQQEEMEELSSSPLSYRTANDSPIPTSIPLPSSPVDDETRLSFPQPPKRLPIMASPSDYMDEGAAAPVITITHRPSLVRVSSHQQQVANNIKQPKRVSSVMGLGGHFSPSPPGTPEQEGNARVGEVQGTQHVRRRSSIQDILSTVSASPSMEGGSGHTRRRSIVSVLLRKGSEEQAAATEPVGPKVIHESSPASTMLATLPPRISSKRSTPNLGRPPFPSANSSPVIPVHYAPFDPRYRPDVAYAPRSYPGGPISPISPHSPAQMHMPPPHLTRGPPPMIHVQPSPRSSSPASRLSSPSTLSVRSSTPNLRGSMLGVRKEEKDVGEKRVSTLNLPPMGFTNSVAPKFSRAGARRSGVIMPTPAYGGGSVGRRPMSHLPSVSSLNTVDEMGNLGGGAGGRMRHSHMPVHSATLGALEGGRVYRQSSTNSLSSAHSSTSDVSASASQRSVRSPTAASNDKDTLETLLESAHSRQSSADLPVPKAAFMRVRQGSAVSTDSTVSSTTASDEETTNASVPSLTTSSQSSASSNDHSTSSVPQTPDLDEMPHTGLPPRIDSRPSPASPSVAIEAADDDAMEEVLAADDGYMRSLNARLQIDVRIAGTSRAVQEPLAFAPPSPRIVTSEDDDTELPYTRGSEEFGVLPPPQIGTIRPSESQSFSRRFFGLGDKGVKGMKSSDSLKSMPSLPTMNSKASMGSLRGLGAGWRTTRGKGQMKEVVTVETEPMPSSIISSAGPSTPVSPSATKGERTEKLKQKKSAVFLGKLGKAFGVKRKDAPPMPVPV